MHLKLHLLFEQNLISNLFRLIKTEEIVSLHARQAIRVYASPRTPARGNINLISVASFSPRLAVAGDADEGKTGHKQGVDPSQEHNFYRHRQFESFIQVYGVGDGVPSLRRDDREREDGQFGREHRQEPGHLAAHT